MDGEGYLILATGSTIYMDMARNLAASLKVMDPGRRVCIVHDSDAVFSPRDHRLFDDFALMSKDPDYAGVMNKIRVFPLSPYQRTMFIDADCYLLKNDVDRYWELSRQQYFTIAGHRGVTGEWKGADLATIVAQEKAPYFVKVHSGAFTFDNSPDAKAFFEGLCDFYLRRRDVLQVTTHRGKPAHTDELYIGFWMAFAGIDGTPAKFGENTWMISTWRAFGIVFDPARGIATIRKPKGSIAGVPNPLKGWDRLSTTFGHFVGLKPRRHYKRLAAYFQAEFDKRYPG